MSDPAPPGEDFEQPLVAGDAYEPFGQLIKMLMPRVLSVAIYDGNSQPLWHSDGVENESLRSLAGETLEARSIAPVDPAEHGIDGCCLFPLPDPANEYPVGVVAIELGEGQSASMVNSLIKPVLDCIASRLHLEGELSNVSQRAAGGDDLSLLLGVEDDNFDGDALELLLKSCVEHIGGALGALVIPDRNLTISRARGESEVDPNHPVLTQTHKHLLAWVQLNNRPMVVNRIAKESSSQNTPYKILSCPVRDGGNRVIGILGLFRSPSEPDFEIRDVRVLELMTRRVVSILDSHFDPLTGLMNRPAFERQYGQHVGQSDQAHTLLYMDIDKLHVINDTFGFHSGDEVIRRFADILRDRLSEQDDVGRIAGDRFAVLLNGRALSEAMDIAEELRAAMGSVSYLKGDRSLPVSVSIGVAECQSGKDQFAHALAAAEVACKAAKDRGRNRVEGFHDDDLSIIKRHNDIFVFATLQQALKDNSFQLQVQPMVTIGEKPKVAGMEVLVRMLDDNDEVLAPDKFISAAERYQLMPAIDRWVISNALRSMDVYWQSLAASRMMVSLNLSGQSVCADGFLNFLKDQIKQTSVDPRCLMFEITETAAIANLSKAEEFIKEAKEIGCQFALDDFGSGLSSFAYLKDLPVDCLKIDGSFVRDMSSNRISESLVVAIAQVAKTMGLSTVAEHVENQDTFERLRGLGLSLGQGFFLGRPKPIDEQLAEWFGSDEMASRRHRAGDAA